MGMAFCWRGGDLLNETQLPLVAGYAARLFARPPFREAVIDWPGIPQSEFVKEFCPD